MAARAPLPAPPRAPKYLEAQDVEEQRQQRAHLQAQALQVGPFALAVWVRQYGMGGLVPYMLFALVLACAFGCLVAPEQIAAILRTGTAPGLPNVTRAP